MPARSRTRIIFMTKERVLKKNPMIVPETVSYTHLDWKNRDPDASPQEVRRNSLLAESYDNGKISKAVSYTHLDVYKRQR